MNFSQKGWDYFESFTYPLSHHSVGHLIWRIDDFSKRLEEAKRQDTVLRSPIFSNKSFGYTLRVSVCVKFKFNFKWNFGYFFI